MPATATTERISLQQHITYICSRLLAYALPLLFFLVVTSFYLKTYDSAQIKITFTQIGTTMLLATWILRQLAAGRFAFEKGDWVWVAPFVAFLLSGVIAWFHSPFKVWSAEETWRRIFYMGIALITVAELRGNERTTRLWRWLMAAAIFAVGYGFVQYLDSRFFPAGGAGLDPFIWRRAFSVRVFSTFGNPNFYGNFLVIVTPLVIASILRLKGALTRPFLLLAITGILLFLVEKLRLGSFGGFDASYEILVSGVIVVLLALFLYYAFSKTSSAGALPVFLILFSMLFISLYSTETKGAWLGFTAALAATMWLIFEYFLHFDERIVEPRAYVPFLAGLGALLALLVGVMFVSFVLPMLRGTVEAIGFQILWIPTLGAGIIAVVTMVLLARRPWNLKKVIYGALVFFVLLMGSLVLQYAKTRLTSVSFRLFTWLGAWEMIHTEPVFGNGVGTFKVIYPAFRPPHIIVLEGRSNTETDHSEDEYLEIWQDEGILGFGIFLWMVITVLIVGLKQLRWYARLRAPGAGRPRKMLEMDSDPRSYEVMGYLGAYIGALIHWTVDVSVRFVSSGVFSGLLPAAIIAQAVSLRKPAPIEPRLSYDRWIRAALALFWTLVMLWLKVELVPQGLIEGGDTGTGQIVFWVILSGLFLWAMLEALEWGNAPDPTQPATPFSAYYPASTAGLAPVRVFLGVVAIVGAFSLMNTFRHHFLADVNHNMGIFFSKESIWTKSPSYASRVLQYPPDIRKKYDSVGGALEHYAEVVRLNKAFPMARYFTGNVYNDWGSQENAAGLNARSKGDMSEAERLHTKSLDLWNKAEEAYTATKALAPNYVQTHHQMGLLDVKRAEAAQAWGDMAAAQKYYDEAYKNFELYHLLDPVFPPNYDRLVQILMMKGKVQESIALYKQALYYNDVVARSIHRNNVFADRVAAISLSLAKLNYNEAMKKGGDPFNPVLPEIEEAIKYFRTAADSEPTNLEALKGMAFLLQKTGHVKEGTEALMKARALAPNDPDILRATQPAR